MNPFSSIDEARMVRDMFAFVPCKRLVFTNGCFDLLHVGHVRYLEQARQLGDSLVIGLNSDASVRGLKGDGRPVMPQEERAEILKALRCVDHVVLFDSLRCTDLIRALKPHVYVKGGDYTVESLDLGEHQALEEIGAEITILPLVPGRSTTQTLQRLAVPATVRAEVHFQI